MSSSLWLWSRLRGSWSWESSTANTPGQVGIEYFNSAGKLRLLVAQHTYRYCTNPLLLSSGIISTRSLPFPGKVAQSISIMNKTGVEFLFIKKKNLLLRQYYNSKNGNKILLDLYLPSELLVFTCHAVIWSIFLYIYQLYIVMIISIIYVYL